MKPKIGIIGLSMMGFITSYIIPLAVPVLLVFKNVFLGELGTWGDAPFFYPEGLSALLAEPAAWTERGVSFGGVNNFIWISPLMILYGAIGNSDWAVRLLFYFPSILFAGFGTFFLTRYLKFSKTAGFFTILIYLLNTYYILLIDGGQVGVALAYGVFPFALLFLRKHLDTPSVKSFYLSLLLLFALGVADPRIFVVCLLTTVFWLLYEGSSQALVLMAPLVVAWAGLNMYWIYPLLTNGMSSVGEISESSPVKWYHPLSLLSPHWPENIFGKIAPLNPYFLAVPILVFLGTLLKRKQSLTFLFLFLTFAFLSLGVLPLTKLPLGFALRDTTKFFIPLTLFAGILIGRAAEWFGHWLFSVLLFVYLLFLISPAISGKMNFVLSGRDVRGDFAKISENLKNENEFLRVAWFPEKHPVAYESENLPAVEARDLVRFRPFADMNAGEDVFNFLNNPEFVEWFRILGVKYLVLSGNPREVAKSDEDRENWEEIKNLVSKTPGLKKLEWEGVPVYEVENSLPRFYAVKKLTAIVGPSPKESFLGPTIFFEDGKLDPTLLEGKSESSVEIVFNGKDSIDLAMSFLQKHFVDPQEAVQSQWASFTAEEYLKYKYQLLIRGVNFRDLDYGKGVAFSTIKGEKMAYNFRVPESGDYMLMIRTMTPKSGQSDFEWEGTPLSLQKGNYKHQIENDSDLKIFNVVALIPKKEYDRAVSKAEVFITHFKVTEPNDISDTSDFKKVEFDKWGTLKYKFELPKDYSWVILTDSYNPLWQLRRGIQYFSPLPVFSMVNGYYLDQKWEDLGLEFRGQENLRWGILWSTVSGIILTIGYLRFSETTRK